MQGKKFLWPLCSSNSSSTFLFNMHKQTDDLSKVLRDTKNVHFCSKGMLVWLATWGGFGATLLSNDHLWDHELSWAGKNSRLISTPTLAAGSVRGGIISSSSSILQSVSVKFLPFYTRTFTSTAKGYDHHHHHQHCLEKQKSVEMMNEKRKRRRRRSRKRWWRNKHLMANLKCGVLPSPLALFLSNANWTWKCVCVCVLNFLLHSWDVWLAAAQWPFDLLPSSSSSNISNRWLPFSTFSSSSYQTNTLLTF